MEIETGQIPSSPTSSSASSSDLDTESTGSFFPDKSTTLGTLMGVRFNPSQPTQPPDPLTTNQILTSSDDRRGQGRRRRRRRRRSGWWKLCRDDSVKIPKKLGEFLEAERRMNAGVLIDGEFRYLGVEGEGEEEEGRLFENGRVLPPAGARVVERRNKAVEASSSRGRLPVLITGICSGVER